MTNRKYTQSEIVSIFAAIAAGWSKDRVMCHWGLTDRQLKAVIRREVARDVVLPDELIKDAQCIWRQAHRGRGQGKLTDDNVRDIRAALSGGQSQTLVAQRFGVSVSLVCRIASGERKAHIP